MYQIIVKSHKASLAFSSGFFILLKSGYVPRRFSKVLICEMQIFKIQVSTEPPEAFRYYVESLLNLLLHTCRNIIIYFFHVFFCNLVGRDPMQTAPCNLPLLLL